MLTLEPLVHRDTLCVAIRGRISAAAYQSLSQFTDRKYSKSLRCFYIRYTADALKNLYNILCQNDEVGLQGFDDAGALSETSLAKHAVLIPEAYSEKLIRMRYSKSTYDNYMIQFRMFLMYLHPTPLEQVTEKIVHNYMACLANEKKVSAASQNQAINAIKFYLEHVMEGERRVYYTERPRKERKPPVVLSDDEVKSLFYHTENVKHRAIMFMFYSAGLRMSELLRLRWIDIDPEKSSIYIRCGKGKKDRRTILSPIAYNYLMHYKEIHRTSECVFEGTGGRSYSARSVNNMLKRNALRAGIEKKISSQTLRHSFAAHMLEGGADMRYIQALLGHESSKTTERYLYVTHGEIDKLRSPMGALILAEGSENKIQ
jgi:integrase/recombinase XerD